MTRLLCLAAVVVATLAVGSSVASAATRTHLWTAMHTYAECHAAPSARFSGDISSARAGGPVTFETLMTNKAALVVRAGNGPHVVEWVTRHGIVERLFKFGELRTVAARLRKGCS